VLRNAKADLSVAQDTSTAEEAKGDLSEMKVLSGQESNSQEDLLSET